VILADYLDDCWEPEDAARLLRDLAGGSAGTPCCLRVGPEGARLVGDDFVVEERAGTASYLWVLWAGSPPSIAEMIALHGEHIRAARG